MSKYTPHTEQDVKTMLNTVGVSSLDGLYKDVPREIFQKELKLPKGKSQYAVEKQMRVLAGKNKTYGSVLRGGGIYDHIIPAAVNALTGRAEFVTAYTPYQAEISQGVLQGIFEYQSLMCALTQMDISNASMYDGAQAAAEAIVMCCERKNKALVLGQVNPQYMAVMRTYCNSHNISIDSISAKDGLVDINTLADSIDADTACVVAQCPNYFGLIEDMKAIADIAHVKNVKFIYIFNPVAAALLPTPGECGVDVAVGEGQPLGLPMAYGGATVGILTCNKALLRRMPGRVVGQTTDHNGRRVFVLTMQAREQHIRREKALSSICSNQALNALTTTVYLSLVGKVGFVEVARQCVDKAHYLANELVKAGAKLKYKTEFFHEFVVEGDGEKWNKILAEQDILGGMPAPDGTLWCVTEKADKETLDKVVIAYKEARSI
ncbi:MAG TPA: aminomethyl-transferring glycine dehydrogenase subunit GcvPA [Eubacteriales bacterium]|nr:aminomethyl-transferring glycine dehydrogenase subunit GcvPA [Eubacteriales bacterium]